MTVSLSGDGGDELFSGYPRYMFASRMWSILSKIPFRGTLGEVLQNTPTGVLDKALLPIALLLRRFGSNGDSTGSKAKRVAEYLNADSFNSFYDSIVSTFQDPTAFVLGSNQFERTAAEPIPVLSNIDYMAFTDTLNYMPNDILTKVDRAGMAVSLEGRMPLLDLKVAEIAWRTPSHMKSADGVGKWPLRQVLYKYVPREMIDRPKKGFGIPVDEWLRGPLATWAADLLSPNRLKRQGILDAASVSNFHRNFIEGKESSSAKLWTILMLQSWLSGKNL